MINIRRANTNDIGEIISLGLQTAELHDFDEAEFFSRRHLQGIIDSDRDFFHVAEFEGKFAGFLISSYHREANIAYLYDIAIKPEFRKKGIGDRLIKECEKFLKENGCEYTWFLVNTDNLIMQYYASKLGYKKGREFYFYAKDLRED